MITLEIVNQSGSRVPRKHLQSFVRDVAHKLKQKKVLKNQKDLRLTLVFLDLKPARSLNREYRKKDYATDVLSFDGLEPGHLGELILCPQVLQKQAKEHRFTYRDELSYMVLHGVLHLLGYDHERSESEAKKMFTLQDRIFSEITGIKVS